MRKTATVALLALATQADAHFGMVIPDSPMVSQADGRSVRVTLSFSHPFEAEGMTLETPVAFGVTHEGETTDMLGALAPTSVFGAPGFVAEIPLDRPGVHVVHMSPQPYWEPAEDAFIVHHTKTYVAAYDDDEGWDAVVGLPVEIAPLTRPFGLWAGNVFQGVVLVDGAPEPFAEIEIEHYGGDEPGRAPNDLMITQTIKADGAGVFSYAAPAPGWWGFAALTESDETLAHDGEEKEVEVGGVLWVRFEPWPQR